MTQIAQDAGLTREALYKALRPEAKLRRAILAVKPQAELPF